MKVSNFNFVYFGEILFYHPWWKGGKTTKNLITFIMNK